MIDLGGKGGWEGGGKGIEEGVTRGGFGEVRSSWLQSPKNLQFPEPLAGILLYDFTVSDWFLLCCT